MQCNSSGSLIAKPCTAQEVAFYESSALHPDFAKFMPTFMGTLSSASSDQTTDIAGLAPQGQLPLTPSDSDTPSSSEVGQHLKTGPTSAADSTSKAPSPRPGAGRKLDTDISLVLENITDGFVRPNVLDVKLGARLWADDTLPSKRERLDKVSQETTSSTLGFRIAGMKVWMGQEKGNKQAESILGSPGLELPTTANEKAKSKVEIIEEEGYRRYDKWYGRAFKDHNVRQGFETFLASAKGGKEDRSTLIASRLAAELRAIQAMLESEESRMYSASILIVYEGDSEALERCLEEGARTPEKGDASSPESNEEIMVGVAEGSNVLSSIPAGVDEVNISELEDDEDDEPPKAFDVRLIDFAHATWTPGQGPDENALQGVRNVAQIMEELAKPAV